MRIDFFAICSIVDLAVAAGSVTADSCGPPPAHPAIIAAAHLTKRAMGGESAKRMSWIPPMTQELVCKRLELVRSGSSSVAAARRRGDLDAGVRAEGKSV